MPRYRVWEDDLYADDGFVSVDPTRVTAVYETRRRKACGGWCDVAVLHLDYGATYTVHDDGRRVAAEVAAAKGAAA